MKTEKQGEKTEQQHKHGERDRERGLRADQEKRPVFAEDAVRKVANGRREGVIVELSPVEKRELARCSGCDRGQVKKREESDDDDDDALSHHCWKGQNTRLFIPFHAASF